MTDLTPQQATGQATRRATRADVPAMAKIVSDWERNTDWMTSPYSEDQIAGFINDAFDVRDIWVGGTPVQGYMSFDPNTTRVGGLYCATTGAGLGKALLDRAKSNQTSIWLTTHAPNLDAQRFYKREGFTEVARIDATPPNTVAEVKMEWQA